MITMTKFFEVYTSVLEYICGWYFKKLFKFATHFQFSNTCAVGKRECTNLGWMLVAVATAFPCREQSCGAPLGCTKENCSHVKNKVLNVDDVMVDDVLWNNQPKN